MKSTVYQKIKEIEQRERYQLDAGDFIAKENEALKNDRREFNGYQIGYHIPAGANWAYMVELIRYNGRFYEIVKVFGQVRHAAYVSLTNYEKEA